MLADVIRYGKNGFAYLQNMSANILYSILTRDYDSYIIQVMTALPTTSNIADQFQQYLAALLPLFILFAYIPVVYNIVFRLVKEKESGVKEQMRMMGMTDAPYWLSWLLHFTFINTMISFGMWGILMYNVNNYSTPFYLFIFIWLYGQAIFGQIIFLQSFFSTSKYAGIVATIVYFGASLVGTLLQNNNVSRAAKVIASIIP